MGDLDFTSKEKDDLETSGAGGLGRLLGEDAKENVTFNLNC